MLLGTIVPNVASGTIWSSPIRLPSPVGTPSTSPSDAAAVSCTSSGNCALLTDATPLGVTDATYVSSEVNGKWSVPVALGLPTNHNGKWSLPSSIFCTSSGNCQAVGEYSEGSYIATETSGHWSIATQLPQPTGLQVLADSISCTTRNNCVVSGADTDGTSETPILEVEVNGVWSLVPVTLPSDAVAGTIIYELFSVNCVSLGNCTAVGFYQTSAGDRNFVVTELAGVWEAGVALNAPTAEPSRLESVACTSVGNCIAVGDYNVGASIEADVIQEKGGIWSVGTEVQLPSNAVSTASQIAGMNSVACSSLGNCIAVGDYVYDSSVDGAGVILSESNGVWGKGVEAKVPADAKSAQDTRPLSISCVPGGACTVVGMYRTSSIYSSFESNMIVPASSPKIIKVVPGSNSLSIHFKAPTSDGGSAIRNYQYSLDAGHSWSTRKTGTTGTILTITGLHSKTTYKVAVRATTLAGSGLSSNIVTAKTN